jgi:RimJ/RimL family protein N-acetyltransferase
MMPPTLEEGPFTLRLPRAEDVSWVFHACQDEDIQRFTTVPSPYAPADAIAWVASAAEQWAQGTELALLVALTESGELLGAASLNFTHGDGRAEIGYWVERDARRRGVAAASVRALERYAAEVLHLQETFLRILEDNTASTALALACGYVSDGPDPTPCKGQAAVRYTKVLGPRPAPAADPASD